MAISILFTLLFLALSFQYSASLFSLSVEKPEDVIVSSPSGTFTAGFYAVGENAFCFAIWFTQPHPHGHPDTVVWMANRDQPVNGKRSTLSLLKTGNLILTDAEQNNVWTTSTASSAALNLLLHDTGNLVLQEQQNGSILWQSFDFPTNTLLTNQKITRFLNLVSSRSQSNYSSGFYKLFFDNENVLCLGYDGPQVSSIYWPDPWLVRWQAGRSTYNSSRVAALDFLGYFSSSDDFNFRTSDYGKVLQRRLTLDHDGNFRVYSRKNGLDNWSITWQVNQAPCRIHGICGPNSTCSYDPVTGRKCSCLPGYTMNNEQDWSFGCKPKFQFSCNETKSRFQFLPNVEFYGYDFQFSQNFTYKQCKNLCLRLCNCKGFQHSYDFDQGNGGRYNCFPKTQLLNGYRSPSFKGSTYLRLPESSDFSYEKEKPIKDNNDLVCSSNVTKQLRLYVKGRENASVKFMLWFATGLGGFEVACIFLVWVFLLIRNRKQFVAETQGYVLATATGFRKFSYFELKEATKNFSQEIGRGAGGIVYKALLSDQRVAAIKRLYEANQGESEFLAEVSIIGRLNHKNLIGMWGYCAEGKHRLLVYEYMENGSLAENLSTNNELDWGKRYNIALGTARGLAYLHEECLEWILHCDIKPQNILLDSDYQPKVADFGLSKLLHRNNPNNSSFSRIRGTRGYMAPEWVFNLPITSKVDVYSYGIVVLEMITGKSLLRGIQIADGEESHHGSLVAWVREKRRKGSEIGSWVEQITDPALVANCDIKKMEILATVALDCVEEDKDVRPNMSQIVEMLQVQSHAKDSG